ncbi:MAG: long-chain fatty acid--CoA ligase, partial [bacterium]
MGHQTEDGFVKITGRIKEQYKLENGKYVVPSPIEESISMSRYIRQVVVCGSNRPYNVCLIVPEWD